MVFDEVVWAFDTTLRETCVVTIHRHLNGHLSSTKTSHNLLITTSSKILDTK
jgi:hypothetical protein